MLRATVCIETQWIVEPNTFCRT